MLGKRRYFCGENHSENEVGRRKFTEREQLNVTYCRHEKRILKRFSELLKAGWGEVWDTRTLRYVAASEVGFEDNFARGGGVKNAEVLESLVNWGITKLKWLGNRPLVDDAGKGKEPFLAHAESASDFDDKKHRVDSVVTLKVPVRCSDSGGVDSRDDSCDSQRHTRVVTIALDTTVWERDDKMRRDLADVVEEEYFAEKISRSNNELDLYQEAAPFGFTQVDFYVKPWDTCGEVGRRGRLVGVPRFVVGISGRLADEIRKADFRWDGGCCVPKGEETISKDERTAMAGFMVMSEIRAQAEMLIKMLPAAADKVIIGGDTSQPKTLAAKREELIIVRDLMHDGICRSVEAVAKLMLSRGDLPREVAAKIQGASRVTAVAMLEKMLMDKDVGAYDATYAGIMRATASFAECAESEAAAGLKKLQPRNKGVKWTGTRVKEIKWE